MTSSNPVPSSNPAKQPIDDLLSRLLDATLTDGEQEQLLDLLQHDPQAREKYHEHIALHAMLHWIDSEPLDLETTANKPPRGVVTMPRIVPVPDAPPLGIMSYLLDGWPLAYLLATVICGIGALIGSVVEVSHPTQFAWQAVSSPATPEATPSSNKQTIGRITSMVDCMWESEGLGIRAWGPERETRGQGRGAGARHIQSLIPNPQSLVSLGDKYALTAGLMEITYDTGAKVVLQGPCTYEVESETGGYLSIGKLTARVEKGPRSKSQGPKSDIQHPTSNISKIPNPSLSTTHSPLFTIKTPTATVTDLGTEFGVEVDQQGGTRSHVFVGAVRVEPAGAGQGTPARAVVLHASDSVVVPKVNGDERADLVVEHKPIAPQSFVRPVELAKMVSDRKDRCIAGRQRCAEQVQRDPALVAYYDFQHRKESPNVLHAVGRGATDARDGLIQGSPSYNFNAIKDLGVNVLSNKPVEVSSVYNNDPTYVAPHLTDQTQASHAFTDGDSNQRLVVHGFNSPLVLVRLWRAEDRIAQQVTVKSSLSDQASLDPADYTETLATLSTLAFNTEGYVDIPVAAPAGTQSLFFAFGDRTEYYPGGGWTHPAGIRTTEIQGFATPPPAPPTTVPECWAGGRTPGRTALHFDGNRTCVKVNLPDRLTQVTIAAWLTIDFIDDQSNFSGLLTSSDWGEEKGSAEPIRWQIRRTGEMVFGTAAHGITTPSVLPWQAWDRRRWRHLAVVADPAQRRAACYLDGKRIHDQPLSDEFAATIGEAAIGGWQHRDGRIDGGVFGRMDELFILSRAMTDAEIHDLYEMERP